MNRLAHLALGAVLGAALAACGGGGNTVAEGGIGGTGISSGSISAFSSIVLNGTKFDVDAATITINGVSRTESDLDVGYVVRVDGDLAKGVAKSVRFDPDLIGEVDSTSFQTGDSVGTITVMQHTVEITGTTIFVTNAVAISGPDDIGPGDRVLVSGFRKSGNSIVAKYLEVAPTGPVASKDQIVGVIGGKTTLGFTIGNLNIEPATSEEPGERVRVRGNYEPAPGSEIFTADTVTALPDLANAGTEIELEGIVDTFNSEIDFTVGGIRVDASRAAVENGPVQPNAEVEVEGVFNRSGVLVADVVEVELEDNVEIVARVVNDPPTGGPVQFFLDGSPLVTVAVTEKTSLRDNSIDDMDNFSVGDIQLGDWVELDGFEDLAGNITALKIERFDPDVGQRASVEAEIDKVEPMGLPNVLQLLGVWFDTTGASDGSGGTFSISSVSASDTVEVRWEDDGSFAQPQLVDQVEIKD